MGFMGEILMKLQTFIMNGKEKDRKQKLVIPGVERRQQMFKWWEGYTINNFMIINVETYIKKFPQKPKFTSWICIRGYVTITMNFVEDNKKYH